MSFGSSIAGLFRFLLSFALIPSLFLRGRLIRSWEVLEAKRVVIYIGLWALKLSVSMVVLVFFECFSEVLLRSCERLPFASQLGWLGPLRHGADIGQTQLRLSLLRHESRAAVLPPSSGAARQTNILYQYTRYCGKISTFKKSITD